MAEQNADMKRKNETIRDRAIGAVMIAAGIVLTIVGTTKGHISMVWPVVGLAGISLFVDSFLKRKPVKIALSIGLILALAAVYFGVRAFNGNVATEEPSVENTAIERIDA